MKYKVIESLYRFSAILLINSKQKFESCSQGVYSLEKKTAINAIIIKMDIEPTKINFLKE